ncbi:MAG: cobalamin biosynthesis protein CbiM [Nitrospirae bacterium GWC2_57_9]|nr:MAG: cobalamin biosynthesis protein CbiM [Nitrospirae bacterium GWC2_57_9]
MHIPDGYLGPATYGTLFGITAPFWGYASWKLNRTLKSRQAPYLALGAAFSFVIMMFNIPVLGGTTGHATGTTLIAVLLGPWATIIAVSVALVIQALLFGDGGITALGANCFNIAVAGGLAGWGIYRVIAAGSDVRSKRRLVAAAIAAYLSLNVSALLTAVELGVQPLLERSPEGQPLYSPYPLTITIPAMLLEHVFLFGVVEAVITALVLRYLQKHEPEMLRL